MIKLLLIDDDPDDRDIFCEALQAIDIKVICYSEESGRAALTKLNKGVIDIPDIIFLDINMPVMDGWQCISILKSTQQYDHVPVVMYSTSSHAEEIAKAQAEGALCYFSKPDSFKELQASLALVVHHIQNNSLSSLTLDSSRFTTTSQN